MKNRIYGTITILILTMLSACGNLLDSPRLDSDGRTGTVQIALEGVSAGARTLMPGQDDFTRYIASFDGPEAKADTPLAGGSLSVELAEGSWTITVTASTGVEGSYADVGRGRAMVPVTPNTTITVDIAVAPIVEAGKQGSFSYSVSIPAVESATMSLVDMNGTAVSGTPVDLQATSSGTMSNLAAGPYLMRIALGQAGGATAGRTEAVHIYDGLTTTANYAFADSDFQAVIDLVGNIWMDEEIVNTGEKQYYRFPVTAGLRYGVWVNDNGYANGSAGDGTKTLNIGVTATYEGSATPIFSPGFNDVSYVERRYVIPHIFTAASSGNVTLEVAKFSSAANNTGTFAIKYGELKPITAGTVETGTLAAGGLQWYAFVPDPSTMYAVSWEDAGEQAAGSAYTGDVEVAGFQTIRNTMNIAAQSTADPAFNPADNGHKAPRFLLSDGGTNANRLQLIKVEAKTGGSYALKLTALTTTPATATPLEAGTAVSDTIATGEVKLYSISLDYNKSYEILWEDAGDQAAGSSYTGDIMVTAHFTIGRAATILFDIVDKGYSTPQRATETSGVHTLIVVGKAGVSSGTYSIKYQELEQEQ